MTWGTAAVATLAPPETHPMDDCLLHCEGQPCKASAEAGEDITNTSSSASEVTDCSWKELHLTSNCWTQVSLLPKDIQTLFEFVMLMDKLTFNKSL